MTRARRARCPYCGRPGDGTPCAPYCPELKPAAPTSPGQVAYTGYVQARHGMSAADAALTYARSVPDERAAWEAAAEAVLVADSDGRHTTTAMFRYGVGDVLRLAGSPCRWRVRARRWVEREVMPPYAEYDVQSPDDVRVWEVEADLDHWEENSHA